MFKSLFKILRKKEQKEIEIEKEEPKEVDIEITVLGNITKVDIKEDCTVMEYVPTMKKRGQEWVEDKIPNATLFDKGVQIKRKIIYLFEIDNISYSCYTTNDVIYINERITDDNNHIDERRITIQKNDDNYIINRLKHDENRSTYYVKCHEKKDPDYAFFQLGKDNAIELSKEVLSNLEKISRVENILDLDFIYKRLDLERKNENRQLINPVQNNNQESIKVKIKK